MVTIRKTYKFYAAHRNLQLGGKCARIHGHRYEVTVVVSQAKNEATQVTIPFQEIDNICEPIIKEHDHWFLVHVSDPIYTVLKNAGEEIKGMPCATSAENLAEYFFKIFKGKGLPILSLELRETDSAVVIYNPQ